MGAFLVLCKDAVGSFTFGVGGNDTVTLFDTKSDLVSTSGALKDLGSTSLSFQRNIVGTYDYVDPTPGKANVFPPPIIIVNEVSPSGSGDTCNGGSWVELLNEGYVTVVGGYVLTNGSDTFTVPANTFFTGGYLVICVTGFDIGATDTIAVLDTNGAEVSTSGQIGGDSPKTGSLVWARKVDLMSGADPVFVYTADATPGTENVFTFEARDVSIQKCGQAMEAYGAVSDYEHVATIEIIDYYEVGVNNEFSGASFYGGTCIAILFGNKFSYSKSVGPSALGKFLVT